MKNVIRKRGLCEEVGPYEEVLITLRNMPGSEGQGIDRQKALHKLQVTPGLFFSPGTTWEDILIRMSLWGWISEKTGKYWSQ